MGNEPKNGDYVAYIEALQRESLSRLTRSGLSPIESDPNLGAQLNPEVPVAEIFEQPQDTAPQKRATYSFRIQNRLSRSGKPSSQPVKAERKSVLGFNPSTVKFFGIVIMGFTLFSTIPLMNEGLLTSDDDIKRLVIIMLAIGYGLFSLGRKNGG